MFVKLGILNFEALRLGGSPVVIWLPSAAGDQDVVSLNLAAAAAANFSFYDIAQPKYWCSNT